MTSLLNEIELADRNSPTMRVLVIEDDQETASFLRRALKEQGHVAEYAGDGQTGLELARANAYDVLIVDRMLPKCDGLTVIGSLRAEEIRTPALILSALGEVDDRVKGLRAGGDDYLTKPYAFSELLARIEALARRTSPEEGGTRFVVGDLVLDRLSHKVTRGGEPIILQPREFRLLEYLMKTCGPSGDPHHVARKRMGLSLRSADQRHRRACLAAPIKDRQELCDAAAAHSSRRRLHHP